MPYRFQRKEIYLSLLSLSSYLCFCAIMCDVCVMYVRACVRVSLLAQVATAAQKAEPTSPGEKAANPPLFSLSLPLYAGLYAVRGA